MNKNPDIEGQIGAQDNLVQFLSGTFSEFSGAWKDCTYSGDKSLLRIEIPRAETPDSADVSVNMSRLLHRVFNDQQLFMCTERNGNKVTVYFEPFDP